VAEPSSVVCVVDDDATVRGVLECLLRAAGFAVQSFSSAADFLCALPLDVPACLILDVRLPGISGLELQRQLAGALPIIFITGYGDIGMTVRAMKAGALEFLQKPIAGEELLHAVSCALERARAKWRATLAIELLQGRFAMLTPRERQVLARVVAGMLNKQIASDLGIAEMTVKTHRHQVMQKLRANSVADLVRMAEKLGVRPGGSSPTHTKV